MRIPGSLVLAALISWGALPAQEDGQKPAFGSNWNTAIGLGGGAGGIYGGRGGGLSMLRKRDSEAAARLDSFEARIAARESWAESKVAPGAAEIEATAWSLLALCVNSTMRSGPRKDLVRLAVADLSGLLDEDGALVLPEEIDEALRLQSLVSWALAETATVSSYRVLKARAGHLADALVAAQLADGSLPATPDGESGDLVTTAMALHTWRTAVHGQFAGEAVEAAAKRATEWLAAQAEAADAPLAARILHLEQRLLDWDQMAGVALPEVDDATWAAWSDRPTLRCAWLTIGRAAGGEAWDAAWERALADTSSPEPAEAAVRAAALAVIELSAFHRYVVRP